MSEIPNVTVILGDSQLFGADKIALHTIHIFAKAAEVTVLVPRKGHLSMN